MGFLKLILLFIIVYYLFKVLGMIFLPLWAKKFAARMSGVRDVEEAKKQARANEGKVTIEYNPGSENQNFQKEKGEYIDYEEVK